MKVIIIGAGAAGLIAANELTKNGIDVLVLERENRIGGRIHTQIPDGFTQTIEAGAEFIHGNLPLTFSLMNQAELDVSTVSGEFYSFDDGRLHSGFGQGKEWQEFFQKADALTSDCRLLEFLDTHFSSDGYQNLRSEAIDMAQGLDLADAAQLSVFSIRDEWQSYQENFRPKTGYGPLLKFLHNQSGSSDYELKLEHTVKEISWQKGLVKVDTNRGIFEANALIITASVGNMQKRQLSFSPDIDSTLSQFDHIGFGQVVKIVLEFDYAFWKNEIDDFGFLFTPEGITFWTQLDDPKPFLTGWIGNAYADSYRNLSDPEIISETLKSLVSVFGDQVNTQFRVGAVFTYSTESASGGGYSYLTVKSKSAIEKLNAGIENTIFFAGEALHPDGKIATVEAALQSGKFVAERILKLI